jgi:hypothetical protein
MPTFPIFVIFHFPGLFHISYKWFLMSHIYWNFKIHRVCYTGNTSSLSSSVDIYARVDCLVTKSSPFFCSLVPLPCFPTHFVMWFLYLAISLSSGPLFAILICYTVTGILLPSMHNMCPCHHILNFTNYSCSVCTFRSCLMSWFHTLSLLVCFLIQEVQIF